MAVPLLIPPHQAIADNTVAAVTTHLPASASRAVRSFFANLPTAMPSEPGVIWNRGGEVFIGPTDPEEPEPFTAPDWSVAAGPASGQVTVTIHNLPYHNGAAISAIMFAIDGGTAQAAPGLTTFIISGLDNDEEISIELWAVNSVGTSPDSDTKTVTPLENPGAYIPALNFLDGRNSQYVPLLF